MSFILKCLNSIKTTSRMDTFLLIAVNVLLLAIDYLLDIVVFVIDDATNLYMVVNRSCPFSTALRVIIIGCFDLMLKTHITFSRSKEWSITRSLLPKWQKQWKFIWFVAYPFINNSTRCNGSCIPALVLFHLIARRRKISKSKQKIMLKIQGAFN